MPVDPGLKIGKHPVIEEHENVVRGTDTPMSCIRCGSTYFSTLNYNQYLNQGYGSSEYKLLPTVSSKPVLVCLCGLPVVPQNKSIAGSQKVRQAVEAFAKSLESVIVYNKNNSVQSIAQIAVTELDLQEKLQQLNALIESKIETLRVDLIQLMNQSLSESEEPVVEQVEESPKKRVRKEKEV